MPNFSLRLPGKVLRRWSGYLGAALLRPGSCWTASRAGAPGAYDWIDAKPGYAALQFTPLQWRCAAALRYGWAVYDFDLHEKKCAECATTTKALLDSLGDHALACGKWGGWNSRHNEIRDIFFKFARRAMFRVEKEVEGLLPSAKRPADVYFYDYKHGRDYVFDVVVTSPFNFHNIQDAAAGELKAASNSTKNKYRNLKDDYDGKAWKFQPLGFEALGGCDEPAQCLIDTIAKRMRDHSEEGALRAATKRSMYREISCALARWAAELVLHHQRCVGQEL